MSRYIVVRNTQKPSNERVATYVSTGTAAVEAAPSFEPAPDVVMAPIIAEAAEPLEIIHIQTSHVIE